MKVKGLVKATQSLTQRLASQTLQDSTFEPGSAHAVTDLGRQRIIRCGSNMAESPLSGVSSGPWWSYLSSLSCVVVMICEFENVA